MTLQFSIDTHAHKKWIVINPNHLVLIIVSLLFIHVFIPGSFGSVAKINGIQKFGWETYDQEILHAWVNDNIPKNANIASNEPTGLYLRTGLSIIPIRSELFDNNLTYLQWIKEKFSIDYIVLYNYESSVKHITLDNDTFLNQVYAIGENSVYQYSHELPPDLEFNPIVIYDDNETNLSLFQYGSGVYDWTLFEESTEKVTGASSAKITRNNGTHESFAIEITFTDIQDWSNKTVFCTWIYGNNTGGIQRFAIPAPDWSNYFWYTYVDNFSGWRSLVIPLKTFEVVRGSPNWSTVKSIRMLDGGTGALYYIDRTIVDSS